MRASSTGKDVTDQARSALTRRGFLGGAVAVGFLATGCGSGTTTTVASTSASTTSAASGPWSFTDDSGDTVTIPQAPKTIVAFSTPAAALAEMGMTPQGIFAWNPLEQDTQLRYVDLSKTEVIGTAWAEFNVEKLASLRPDLIVTMYDSGDGSLYGFADDQQISQIKAIAPIVAIDIVQPLVQQFDRFQQLGESVGADLGSAALLDAREAFNTATAALKSAAAVTPGLKVLAVGAGDTGYVVAQITTNADLSYYRDLGLGLIEPDGEGIFYWEDLSWEELGKYQADVILIDSRKPGIREIFESQPLWAQLPAVQADQVGNWHAFDPPTYRFYVDALAELTALIEKAKIVTQ